MWRAGLVVGFAAGCFQPLAPLDVPCAPASAGTDRCPDKQACVHVGNGEVCMPSDDDVDGDGILNASDNCPTVPNPDQDNYDHDAFGDACDPCPIVANNNPVDTDGDGVSDDCDPYPGKPGDKIALFEGFAHGVPSDWTAVGPWGRDPAGGVVGTTTSTTTFAYLVPPYVATSEECLEIGVQPKGDSPPTGIGVIDPTDDTADDGAFCGFVTSQLELADVASGTVLAADPLSVTTIDTYGLAMIRNGGSDSCTGTPTKGAVVSVGANVVSSTTDQSISIGVDDGSLRLLYAMVITQTGDESP